MGGTTRNFGVYVREARQANGDVRKEVFKTHRSAPLSEWGDVTCIHPDVEHLRDGEAMVHALKVVGYHAVPMK